MNNNIQLQCNDMANNPTRFAPTTICLHLIYNHMCVCLLCVHPWTQSNHAFNIKTIQKQIVSSNNLE